MAADSLRHLNYDPYPFDPIREFEEAGRAYVRGLREGSMPGFVFVHPDTMCRLRHPIARSRATGRKKHWSKKLTVMQKVQQLARKKGRMR